MTHLHYDHVGDTKKLLYNFDNVKIIVSTLGNEIDVGLPGTMPPVNEEVIRKHINGEE